jgi:hypothetical protein
MPTKEEMFRGIVKVNNERIDNKVIAHTVKDKVQGDDSSRADQPSGDNRTRAPSNAHPVSRPKESLRAFAERRKSEILSALEEVTDAEIRVEIELKGLRDERHDLLMEQRQLERLYDDEDQCTSAGHQPAAAPDTVLSDKGKGRGGRGSSVGGKRDSSKRAQRKSPDAEASEPS